MQQRLVEKNREYCNEREHSVDASKVYLLYVNIKFTKHLYEECFLSGKDSYVAFCLCWTDSVHIYMNNNNQKSSRLLPIIRVLSGG